MANSFKAAYEIRTPDHFERAQVHVQSYRFPTNDAQLNRALDYHAASDSGGRYDRGSGYSLQGFGDSLQIPGISSSLQGVAAEDAMARMLSKCFGRLSIEDSRGAADLAPSSFSSLSSVNYGRKKAREPERSRSKASTYMITYDFPQQQPQQQTPTRSSGRSSSTTSHPTGLSAYSGNQSTPRYVHESDSEEDDWTIKEDSPSHHYTTLPKYTTASTQSHLRDDVSVAPSDSISQASSKRSKIRTSGTKAWSEVSRGRTRRRPRSVVTSSSVTLGAGRPGPKWSTYTGRATEQYGDALVKDITPW